MQIIQRGNDFGPEVSLHSSQRPSLFPILSHAHLLVVHVGGATNPAFLNKNKKSEIRSMQKDNCEIIIVSQKKQQMLHLLL